MFKASNTNYQKPPVGAELKQDHPLVRGLVHCWLFNENKGQNIYDMVAKYKGIFINTPTWSGGSMLFNGSNDYITHPNSLNIINNVTFSLWVYCRSSEAAAINYPFSCGSSGTTRISIIVGGTYSDAGLNAKAIGLWDGSNVGESGSNTFTAANDDNKWRHIILDYNASRPTKTLIYKDTINLATSFDNISGNLASMDTIEFGRRVTNQYYWNGYIANCYIWNRSLTPAEISWLYREPYAFIRPKML